MTRLKCFLLLPCLVLLAMLQSISAAAPAVALYMSESSGVMDLSWDSSPGFLHKELVDLGLAVEIAADGQPHLSGTGAPSAFVIPAQNGHTLYSEAEDMADVTAFVAAGGLVVVLDSGTGEGAALRSFAGRALQLKGVGALDKLHLAGGRMKREDSSPRALKPQLGPAP
jgi:hypothetical protein